MSRKKERNGLFVILSNLGWPLLLGAAATSIFYALVFQGQLNVPLVHRYFAGHPVAFVTTGMFFVGMAALCLKLLNVLGQFISLNSINLEEPPKTGQKIEAVDRLLASLDRMSVLARNSYMSRRLRDALRFIQRKGATEGLDDELRYLADLDVARQQDSYGLVRIITWATPMLGFLGTVIGITQALGDLDPTQLATDIQGAMDGLLAGLYVAFDTTALALSLSIVLMFILFLIERIETQLLATVDIRSTEQMVGRFEQLGTGTDPHLASVERMSNEILKATKRLVRQQAKLWQTTIDAAHQHWTRLYDASGQQLQTSLENALDQSLVTHAAKMASIESETSERAYRRWEQLQSSLSDNAQVMRAQQQEMIKQGEVIANAVKATGDIIKLEKSLNDNLGALAGAKNFEDTVISLSAAIHLLSARLGGTPEDAPKVDLKQHLSKGRAA